MPLAVQAAADSAPAGGAAIGQVVEMVVALSVGFGALLYLGEAERRGRRTPLRAAAAFCSRVSGLPAWAALPLGLCGVALVGALFGFMWDVSLHIDHGRDNGPFGNPSHYFILAGLFGIVASGYLSLILVRPGEVPGRSALRLRSGQAIPLGALLICLSGLFALAGFPLDDVWHRLFGQDVTLWGPTHLILLSGGMLTLVGVAVLFQEGVAVAGERRAAKAPKPEVDGRLARIADALPGVPPWPTRALIAAGFLGGLSIYQGEFDYGVPQFELVLQPLMIAMSAGLALVAARVWLGRGGALAAVAIYWVIRGSIWLLVGPILGQSHHAFPLYLPEAICVEAVALVLSRRPLLLGPVAGLVAGLLGFFGEWPWINLVMPIHWNVNLLPEGPMVAAIGGTAAGTIGALFGLALRRELPSPRLRPGAMMAASVAVLIGCFWFGLADTTVKGASAQVTLTQVRPAPDREVLATARFHPSDLADGASWVRAVAWQGGGRVGFPLERIGEGVYRTPQPLPVYGKWKTALRVQNGHTMLGVSVYAPADSAVPVPETPALASFTRPMQPDRALLQRERKRDVPGWLWDAATFIVFVLILCVIAVLAAGVGRFARGPRSPAERSAPVASPGAVRGVRV